MFQKSIAAHRPFKLALIASLAMVAAVSSAPIMAADADASATVIVPLTIAKVTDLAFGKFASGTGGTVTMDTAGVRGNSGGVLLAAGGSEGAATFTVTGEPDSGYAITLPATTTLNGPGGATMVLTLGSDTNAGGTITGNATAGTLNAGGTQTLSVGGSLAVAAAQTPGAYLGTFAATVAYQ